MHRLDAARILELSERGAALSPSRRALLVLAAAFPDVPETRLLGLPLGARDGLLMRVRAALFGEALTARQACIACAEAFELSFTAAQLGFSPAGEAEGDFPEPPRGILVLGRRRHPVRALTSADMLAAEEADGPEAARAALIARAVPDAPADALDAARVAEALEALDPLADITLDAACPACGAANELQFDAAAFVWRELVARAPRILRDVADLARAFHWSERDILAMPASRRAFYLAQASP
ncbi:MAG: hypothetical protein QOD42_744 [Sphingomonadales bacterium]|jgi:hypothetical protein|nr:hypothetical protein [Sphingomonadales bacterium]